MAVRSKSSRHLKIAGLRSERGYSATNYDASVEKPPKTLRCQFGRFYDVKKVRNIVKEARTVLVSW
jgi:hypothetical protein